MVPPRLAGVCDPAVSQRLSDRAFHDWPGYMNRDQELWGCALAVTAQHGEGAFLVASMHVDRLDRDNNTEAAAVWREVLRRIEILQSAENKRH